MVSYLIFSILPALAAFIYTLYLAFVTVAPSRVRGRLDKYKKGTPAYEMRRGVYSKDYLRGWIYISLFFAIRIAWDIYKTIQRPPLLVMLLELLGIIATISIGGYYIRRAFNKR